MKECSNCHLVKELVEFEITRNQCQECRKMLKKKYYLDNRERELLKCKKYREENKDKIKESDKKYYESNKEIVKNRVKLYSKNNVDIIKQKKKEYYIENKDKFKKYSLDNKDIKREKRRKYDKENREKINEYQRNYFKDRRENDPLFKLSGNIRGLIKVGLKNKGYNKKSKTKDILGCSFEDFKLYIENKFESWMSWDNYGKYNGEVNYGWDIDHIIPLKIAKTEEELLELSNFNNLQPLCSKINRDIKRDLYFQ